MFIGYYNTANFVTLTGLASAVCACFLAQGGQYKAAVIVFMISGLCDMIDGRIARATNKGDRRRKLFGIQIDSLCDMVSFGVAPGIIAYAFGFCDVFDTIIYIFFACCGAIRLAYFNTQALTEAADLNMKSFTGMPIPSICFVLPPLALLTIFVTPDIMHWLFKAAYLVVGTAFIANFKMKKPGLKTSLISAAVMIACLIALLCFGKMQLLA